MLKSHARTLEVGEAGLLLVEEDELVRRVGHHRVVLRQEAAAGWGWSGWMSKTGGAADC